MKKLVNEETQKEDNVLYGPLTSLYDNATPKRKKLFLLIYFIILIMAITQFLLIFAEGEFWFIFRNTLNIIVWATLMILTLTGLIVMLGQRKHFRKVAKLLQENHENLQKLIKEQKEE